MAGRSAAGLLTMPRSCRGLKSETKGRGLGTNDT